MVTEFLSVMNFLRVLELKIFWFIWMLHFAFIWLLKSMSVTKNKKFKGAFFFGIVIFTVLHLISCNNDVCILLKFWIKLSIRFWEKSSHFCFFSHIFHFFLRVLFWYPFICYQWNLLCFKFSRSCCFQTCNITSHMDYLITIWNMWWYGISVS